jgi:hypothetical protein
MSKMHGGKGDKQRPLTVPKEQFESNWEKIFGKKNVKNHECNGLCGEYECKENQSTCARIAR